MQNAIPSVLRKSLIPASIFQHSGTACVRAECPSFNGDRAVCGVINPKSIRSSVLMNGLIPVIIFQCPGATTIAAECASFNGQ